MKFLRFISASLIGLCNGVVQRAEPGLDKENDPTFQGHSTKSFTELTGHNPTVAETDMLDFNTQGQQCYLYWVKNVFREIDNIKNLEFKCLEPKYTYKQTITIE